MTQRSARMHRESIGAVQVLVLEAGMNRAGAGTPSTHGTLNARPRDGDHVETARVQSTASRKVQPHLRQCAPDRWLRHSTVYATCTRATLAASGRSPRSAHRG